MPETARHDSLVEELAGSLAPVRRLAGPGRRALGWCAAALALGLGLVPFADLSALETRLGVMDLRLSALGAALTAAAAAFAAFQTSVPGRTAAWALLPLPPLALWLGASGLGCLRAWVAPASNLPGPEEMRGCFAFLVGVSLPLSLLLVLMLRRACPLRPNLTAALGGLAASAAAALLLLPIHPHDATATDLAIHLVAILLVIGLNALAGGRLLDGGRRAPRPRAP
ncbi:NrsF family protein [Methylobacterium sp. A54F]